MIVHVNNISGIAHQLMADGKPCNRYIAIVRVSEFGIAGRREWFIRIVGPSVSAVEKKLVQYETNEQIDVPESDLYDKTGVKYGATRNTFS